jgi:hypothetical protein
MPSDTQESEDLLISSRSVLSKWMRNDRIFEGRYTSSGTSTPSSEPHIKIIESMRVGDAKEELSFHEAFKLSALGSGSIS